MPQWEENTMNEYLFERFREDKIERDQQYLMILNKESKRKEHGYLMERGNTTLDTDLATDREQIIAENPVEKKVNTDNFQYAIWEPNITRRNSAYIHVPMSEWCKDDQPRYKMLCKGKS